MLLFLSDNMVEPIPVEDVYIPSLETGQPDKSIKDSLWGIIPAMFGETAEICSAMRGGEEELNGAVSRYLSTRESFSEGGRGKIEERMRWKDRGIWKIVESISPSTKKTVFDSPGDQDKYEKTCIFISPQYAALKRIKHGDKVTVLGPRGYVSNLNAHIDPKLRWFELGIFNEHAPIISEKGTCSSFIDTIYVKKKF